MGRTIYLAQSGLVVDQSPELEVLYVLGIVQVPGSADQDPRQVPI